MPSNFSRQLFSSCSTDVVWGRSNIFEGRRGMGFKIHNRFSSSGVSIITRSRVSLSFPPSIYYTNLKALDSVKPQLLISPIRSFNRSSCLKCLREDAILIVLSLVIIIVFIIDRPTDGTREGARESQMTNYPAVGGERRDPDWKWLSETRGKTKAQAKNNKNFPLICSNLININFKNA